MTGNNIVPIQPSTNVQAYRASTDAAELCRQMVVATARNIQGRRYVQIEGWQAIAAAHGCLLSARDVRRVDGGFSCIGEVRRMSDGAVLAEAEGFVGEDEPTWFGGKAANKTMPKRPDYAIRAMCQTRGMSRAGRSAFAHVVVMMNAGLQTTPAEEVPSEGFDDPNVIDVEFEGTPQPPRPKAQSRETFDRLTKELRALVDKTEDDLTAWYRKEADTIGSLPNDWRARMREEYGDTLAAIRARSADPYGLFIEPPADDTPEAWTAYVDEVLTGISGAPDVEQVTAAQTVNAEGLTLAMAGLEGVAERIAEAAEQRLAFLASRQEEAA